MLFVCFSLKISGNTVFSTGKSARARFLIGVGGSARATFQLAAKKKGGPEEKFVCENCGVEHIRWVGRCDSCNEWNTVKAFRASRTNPLLPLDPRGSRGVSSAGSGLEGAARAAWSLSGTGALAYNSSVIEMSKVDLSKATQRVKLWSPEMNRVLGGGLVRGSATLLAGEPGIGKSTLLAQLASTLGSSSPGGVVYVSGEENVEQIAARAHRLGLRVDNVFLMCDTDADYAVETIFNLPQLPQLIIVDSVQTMRVEACASGLGSVTHIREATLRFVQAAKASGAAVVLVGHVTKAGDVAGPRVLEHMVDTVLYMEGSEHADYRLLKSIKNRFGSTSEVGVFSMEANGMVDVLNPSELFMSSSMIKEGTEGAAVSVILEGTRPILAEVQCLVGSHNGMKMSPRRTADGLALPRLQLIAAVLEKRLGLDLGQRDIYLNVVGGLKLTEPSADLAVAMSIVSSLLGIRVRPGVAFVGELGLGGEIRGGKALQSRVSEAVNMGFSKVVVPRGKKGSMGSASVIACGHLRDALAAGLDCKDLNAALKQPRRQRDGVLTGRGGREGRGRSSRYSSGEGDESQEDDQDQNPGGSWQEKLLG